MTKFEKEVNPNSETTWNGKTIEEIESGLKVHHLNHLQITKSKLTFIVNEIFENQNIDYIIKMFHNKELNRLDLIALTTVILNLPMHEANRIINDKLS